MVDISDYEALEESVFKNEHNRPGFEHDIPKGALLLGVLKTIETQLQRRGLLKSCNNQFNPLWFVAETERNVFLWRNQLSLTQQDEFEFWVNVDKLVEKRLAQLTKHHENSDFDNPVWGLAVSDRQSARKEVEYLLAFSRAVERIQSHANALSHVGILLEKEITYPFDKRGRIVLPL